MEVIVLTEENVSRYEDYISQDVAENIGRTYHRGLIVTNDDVPVAGMVWELKNVLKEKDVESRIIWMTIEDESAGDVLFGKYDELIKEASVIKSYFSLPARTGKEEKKLLKEKGFTVALMEGDQITARLSEIAEIEFVKKIKKAETINPLRFITQRGFNSVLRRMMSIGHYGICEDLPYLPRSYFENDISCFSEVDGVINGLLLCHKYPSGKIEVSMIAAVGKDYVKILPYMIAISVQNALEIYPPETEVIIDRHNYASLALGEKLFPRGFGVPVYIGERSENGGM